MREFAKKYLVAPLAGVTPLVLLATNAHAVAALTVPAIDLTDFYSACGVLLTALIAIWVAVKVIGFFKHR